MDNQTISKILEAAMPLINLLHDEFNDSTSVIVTSQSVSVNNMILGLTIERNDMQQEKQGKDVEMEVTENA